MHLNIHAHQMKVERGWFVEGPPMARSGTVRSLLHTRHQHANKIVGLAQKRRDSGKGIGNGRGGGRGRGGSREKEMEEDSGTGTDTQTNMKTTMSRLDTS